MKKRRTSVLLPLLLCLSLLFMACVARVNDGRTMNGLWIPIIFWAYQITTAEKIPIIST